MCVSLCVYVYVTVCVYVSEREREREREGERERAKERERVCVYVCVCVCVCVRAHNQMRKMIILYLDLLPPMRQKQTQGRVTNLKQLSQHTGYGVAWVCIYSSLLELARSILVKMATLSISPPSIVAKSWATYTHTHRMTQKAQDKTNQPQKQIKMP
jgi:hypothetical protein